MKTQEEIIEKIKELDDKKWKSREEENQLTQKNGRLNEDRLVQFGNYACLDVYNDGRFHLIIKALEWALSESE